jgi:hypothetical protein
VKKGEWKMIYALVGVIIVATLVALFLWADQIRGRRCPANNWGKHAMDTDQWGNRMCWKCNYPYNQAHPEIHPQYNFWKAVFKIPVDQMKK